MIFKKDGFTLTEMLVAMAITGIVMGAAYSVYYSQQKSQRRQEQFSDMEKNLRVALYFMEREIRTAGCDPTGTAGAGIKTAKADAIEVTMDLKGGDTDGKDNDGDGSIDEADEAGFGDGDTDDPNEDVTYSLYTSDGVQKLGRKSPATANNQPVAENIDVLNFVYLDKAGSFLTVPADDADPQETEQFIRQIKAVQITVVARSSKPDPSYINTTVYKNQQGDFILKDQEGVLIAGPPNDHYHRKSLSTLVSCRNLGF